MKVTALSRFSGVRRSAIRAASTAALGGTPARVAAPNRLLAPGGDRLSDGCKLELDIDSDDGVDDVF